MSKEIEFELNLLKQNFTVASTEVQVAQAKRDKLAELLNLVEAKIRNTLKPEGEVAHV